MSRRGCLGGSTDMQVLASLRLNPDTNIQGGGGGLCGGKFSPWDISKRVYFAWSPEFVVGNFAPTHAVSQRLVGGGCCYLLMLCC